MAKKLTLEDAIAIARKKKVSRQCDHYRCSSAKLVSRRRARASKLFFCSQDCKIEHTAELLRGDYSTTVTIGGLIPGDTVTVYPREFDPDRFVHKLAEDMQDPDEV